MIDVFTCWAPPWCSARNCSTVFCTFAAMPVPASTAPVRKVEECSQGTNMKGCLKVLHLRCPVGAVQICHEPSISTKAHRAAKVPRLGCSDASTKLYSGPVLASKFSRGRNILAVF